MAKNITNTEQLDIYLDFFRCVAYSYIIKNYSTGTAKNLEYHIVKSSINESSAVAIVMNRGNGEFKLVINHKTNSIKHIGDYSINRNYPSEKLIAFAKTKYKI